MSREIVRPLNETQHTGVCRGADSRADKQADEQIDRQTDRLARWTLQSRTILIYVEGDVYGRFIETDITTKCRTRVQFQSPKLCLVPILPVLSSVVAADIITAAVFIASSCVETLRSPHARF